MEIIKTQQTMQERSRELQKKDCRIVFVPTLGALHEGHLSLIDIAKKNGDIVVLSIYLNPTQFSPSEDLSKYPANLEKDLQLAKSRGVGIVFCPNNAEIYPDGFQTTVEVTGITQKLCGSSRPTHFRGVTTVVAKLFNIVSPHVVIFGEKDYQQLKVIEQMVRDLNMNIEIIGAPIFREEDGLAMSSRNQYLSHEERRAAAIIFKSLMAAKEKVWSGEKNSERIISLVKEMITETGIGKIDYVELCNPETLDSVTTIAGPTLLAVAAHFGPARLIDNCIL